MIKIYEIQKELRYLLKTGFRTDPYICYFTTKIKGMFIILKPLMIEFLLLLLNSQTAINHSTKILHFR